MQIPAKLRKYESFVRQWKSAIQRGVRFDFDFPEWEAWWVKHLGKDWQDKRGGVTGKYCMARRQDKGPYAPWNVECTLFEINCRDKGKNGTAPRGTKHGMSKITDKLAKQIYVAGDFPKETARQLNVSVHIVRQVRTGKTWRHATKGLPLGRMPRKMPRVNRQEAKAIYLHPGSVGEITRIFNRSYLTVVAIKKGKLWRRATKGLTAPPENKWGRLGGHALKGTTKA
jgi:hypothetical protein